MTAPHAQARRQFVLLALVAACTVSTCMASGCAWLPGRKVPLDATSGFYETATLSYRLDAGRLQQPLDVLRVEGHQVSYDQVASSPLSEHTIGTLSIAVPHPSGLPQMAQARFTLVNSPPSSTETASWNPFKKKPVAGQAPPGLSLNQPELLETWVLDISRAEVDNLFTLLNNQGFYESSNQRASGLAELSVNMNGRQLTKSWDQLPELNALVQRVRRDGRLVSYQRPEAPPPSAARFASIQALQALSADSPAGNPSALASHPASAFSMPGPSSRIEVAERPQVPVR